MKAKDLTPPDVDELEISLFGPGYGEAIAIHFGNGKWMLIDSCIEPGKNLPASVNYLADIDVDISGAVKLLLATHWDDDHVRGLALTLGRCSNALFFISGALHTDEFQKLLNFFYRNSPIPLESGIDEFTKIIQLLEGRKKSGVRFPKLQTAVADKILFRDSVTLSNGVVEIKISSLSPSDSAIIQSRLALAKLLPEVNERKRRIASPSPNHASVVIWLEVGTEKVLLGADLEVTNNPSDGWSIILSESKVINGKADVFKIPHHGSPNAHHPRVWTDLLSDSPYSIVTPFNRGTKSIPSSEDIERIKNLTSNAYATAPTKTKRIKWKKRIVKEMLDQSTSEVHGIISKWGHIRLRKKINSSEKWKVDLFGDAYEL